MVAAAFTVLFVVYGIQFSFGTFVGDITADTGWPEATLQLLIAFYIFGYSALSVVTGWLTDVIGPRKVVAVGSLVLIAGYALWATAPDLWLVLIGLSIVAPVGMSASWVPCNATVVRWFTLRRGLATGISSAGGSAANIVVPPIAAALIEAYGWRTALLVIAIVGGALMLLSASVLTPSPESVGQFPDGVERPSGAVTGWSNPQLHQLVGTQPPADHTPAEAWRSPTYWITYGMYALTFSVVFVPFLHLVQFSQSLGVTSTVAATAVSAIGIGGLLGRVVVGPMSDRLDRRRAVAVSLVLEVLGFVGMAASSGLALLYPSAVAFGMAYGGTVAVFPALVADYFGRAHAGVIVGRIFATAGAMAAIGPYVAQLMFDWLGNYRWVFMLCALVNALALLLALRLPRLAPGLPKLTKPAG